MMASISLPYWINATLTVMPAVLWAFFGLGLPWALVALPRKDWSHRILVITLTLAFGPAILTAWMFILGTLGASNETILLRFDLIFAGTVILAAVGTLLAWRKSRLEPPVPKDAREPLALDEKLLIALIIVAVVIRWFTTAFWPFTSYDPIWVYGYEGRLYTLLGYIPQHIGYYPQFLPLQYTYAQLAAGGVNDHAARAVIPFLHVGAILAVYVLGRRLFNRRTGIFAAALWALYPHVSEWAHIGDLEIPQTFLLTLTAAFFLMAWTGQQPRRRYAIIAGLVYGVALWTKPTAGAFVWGVILLVGLELIRLRLDWRAWLPRFEVAAITGLACLPLGGVWYVRNVLLGHNAIDMPPDFWLTQSQRSGVEFGWPLLALLMLLAYLYVGPLQKRPVFWRSLVGLLLVLAGLLPSIIEPHRMGWLEWGALLVGAGMLYHTLSRFAQNHATDDARAITGKISWVLALALPYFVTWYYSYSYHYRLSFAIVPLMLLPTAVILAYWLKPSWLARLAGVRRWVYLLLIVFISLPGVIQTLYHHGGGWDWLWTDTYPSDFARYQSDNPSLINAVAAIEEYVKQTGQRPVIVAPGAQLMPFFFPLDDVRIDQMVDRLEQLDDATHYVYSKHAFWAYEEAGILPENNQIVSALAREDIMQQVAAHDDGNFFYEVYQVDTAKRFTMPELTYLVPDEIILGGFVRYLGANVHRLDFQKGSRMLIEMGWEVLAPIPEDYEIYVHLMSEDGQTLWATWDGPYARGPHGYYSTLLWEPGEYIFDRRFLSLQDPEPPAGDYDIIVGMYNLETGARVPVTINGEPAGDGMNLFGDFVVK